MNTTNQSLFDLVNSFDNVARIPALRGIVHSAMAKCIGAIRQDIRNRQWMERNAENPQIDLDQRNMVDEYTRRDTEDTYHAEFESKFTPPPSALNEASLLHAVYDWADSELRTLTDSVWDRPLTVEEMLDFMVNSATRLNSEVAKALAEAAETDVETITKMHEIQAQREQEQLLEAMPEIILTFKGFGRNGYEDCIKDLPKVAQHQLGVKVVEALGKARDQVLARVLRTRRISELGAVPVLKAAEQEARRWVEQFEQRHKDEIREAAEAGRNIRTLEDITTTS